MRFEAAIPSKIDMQHLYSIVAALLMLFLQDKVSLQIARKTQGEIPENALTYAYV